MKNSIKSGAKKLLRGVGLNIARVGGPADRATMEGAFRALSRRKYAFKTVVDIGASNGSWSASLMRYFAECHYFLVEAQPAHEKALQTFCTTHANAEYVLAAAGERSGHIFFDAAEPLGGQAAYTPHSKDDIRVPVVTIDGEVATRKLEPPYLLKFDTHGFEIPILKGAVSTLEKTEVVIMECYNFRIAPEALTFDEMCAYMGERGFRCIDLVEPMHRPYDDAFWQMDLVFVKKHRPEFSYQRYR